ncbi:MAG TPA: hypothetical protein VF172_13930 [Nitrososphaera sp.]
MVDDNRTYAVIVDEGSPEVLQTLAPKGSAHGAIVVAAIGDPEGVFHHSFGYGDPAVFLYRVIDKEEIE